MSVPRFSFGTSCNMSAPNAICVPVWLAAYPDCCSSAQPAVTASGKPTSVEVTCMTQTFYLFIFLNLLVVPNISSLILLCTFFFSSWTALSSFYPLYCCRLFFFFPFNFTCCITVEEFLISCLVHLGAAQIHTKSLIMSPPI